LDPYREPQFIPKYRSQFGGLWTDLNNAHDIVQGKLDLGLIRRDDAEKLNSFVDNGYVVLPGAIPGRHVRKFNEDLEKVWTGKMPDQWVGCNEDGRSVTRKVQPGDRERADLSVRLLDPYETIESARVVMFNETITHFLRLIFERPILAHQGLSFYRGSKQPMHRDTAFVRLSSPMEFAAAWIALEDIQEGSGELEYYPKSHTYPDFLFEGKYKWLPPGNNETGRFHEDLRERARASGTTAVKFRARKGDVFIWCADLAHGGSSYSDDRLTRKSLVVHYCPANVYPMYHVYDGQTEGQTGKIQFRKACFYTSAKKSPWRSGPVS
jgi:phytanoyl-CoA hydroxylase